MAAQGLVKVSTTTRATALAFNPLLTTWYFGSRFLFTIYKHPLFFHEDSLLDVTKAIGIPAPGTCLPQPQKIRLLGVLWCSRTCLIHQKKISKSEALAAVARHPRFFRPLGVLEFQNHHLLENSKTKDEPNSCLVQSNTVSVPHVGIATPGHMHRKDSFCFEPNNASQSDWCEQIFKHTNFLINFWWGHQLVPFYFNERVTRLWSAFQSKQTISCLNNFLNKI